MVYLIMVDLVSLFYIQQQQNGSKPVARKQHKKENAESKIGNSDLLYAMHHLTEFRIGPISISGVQK